MQQGRLHQSLRETLSGQMQYEYFPITLDAFAADIRYHDLVEGAFEVGDAKITAKYLNHPALTLGFRIEADSAAIVYACDHESVSRQAVLDVDDLRGPERDHVEFLSNADLVVHDAQYIAKEYDDRIGWGHSTAEYAIEVCKAAGVRRLAISHHDPDRHDDALDRIIENLRTKLAEDCAVLQLSAAMEGEVIEIKGGGKISAEKKNESFPATQSFGSAKLTHRLDLGALRPDVEHIIRLAADAEGVATATLGEQPDAVALRGPEQSIVILDREAAPKQFASFIERAAAPGSTKSDPAPLLPVSDRDNAGQVLQDQTHDLLIWPFTKEFAQSRIRAAILRERCRWVRAPKPRMKSSALLRFIASMSSTLQPKNASTGSRASPAAHSTSLSRLSHSSIVIGSGSSRASAWISRKPRATPHSARIRSFAANRSSSRIPLSMSVSQTIPV